VDTEDVWRLVARARDGVADPDDVEAVARRAASLLAQRDPAEILAFERPLWQLMARSYRADLWAAAYLIRGGCSDDGFDYFRGWLIAQGRDTFEAALDSPDGLAGLRAIVAAAEVGDDALECEDMVSVVWSAYRSATGREMPDSSLAVIQLPELDPEWDFDFDDESEMSRRLPRLASLYYG
jgi:hypothetical protein